MIWKRRETDPGEAVLLAWALPFFIVTGSFQVKFLRYLLPLTPLLAIYAAGIAVPPGTVDHVGQSVTVYITGSDENGSPGAGIVNHMTFPLAQTKREPGLVECNAESACVAAAQEQILRSVPVDICGGDGGGHRDGFGRPGGKRVAAA